MMTYSGQKPYGDTQYTCYEKQWVPSSHELTYTNLSLRYLLVSVSIVQCSRSDVQFVFHIGDYLWKAAFTVNPASHLSTVQQVHTIGALDSWQVQGDKTDRDKFPPLMWIRE